jgi:hypothetical protein
MPDYDRLQLNIRNNQIIQMNISFERNILVAERFIESLINTYDKQMRLTECGIT